MMPYRQRSPSDLNQLQTAHRRLHELQLLFRLWLVLSGHGGNGHQEQPKNDSEGQPASTNLERDHDHSPHAGFAELRLF